MVFLFPEPSPGHGNKAEPLIGGVSISANKLSSYPLTLGIALVGGGGEKIGLTVRHGLQLDDDVVQPGVYDHPNKEWSRSIGTVTDLISGVLKISLDNPDTVYGHILNIDSKVSGFLGKRDFYGLSDGESVFKSGRSTGLTEGEIVGRPKHDTLKVRTTSNQDISQKGDSGSIWLNKDYQIVGIHMGATKNDDDLAEVRGLWTHFREWSLII